MKTAVYRTYGPPDVVRVFARPALALLLALLALAQAAGAQTVQPAADAPARMPDWLRVAGEARVRYETLDGQFRARRSGGDQLALFRSLFLVEARGRGVAVGLELQDGRTYLGDEGTPLSTSIVNPLDILQAYVSLTRTDLVADGSRTTVKIGRQTLGIGSQRQIERVEFANVIRNYTGAYVSHVFPRGDSLHAFYTAPVAQEPTERERLGRNDLSPDREQWNRRLWALHYIRNGLTGTRWPDVSAEVFVYGLNEKDTVDSPTPNRRYVTPGVRLVRPRATGLWNFDLEGAWRYGSRRETSAAADLVDLDVSASMLRVEVGHTLRARWQPNLAVQYYWASGDRRPDDGRYQQYERLFGSRRTDLGNTSIHGPLTPANLSAPGFRVEVTPTSRMEARFTYSAASLASATDRWIVAGLRDPSGASGRFIGHALDARTRVWLVTDTLRFEAGASALIFGRFARSVPGGPAGRRTLFGYSQLLFLL